MIVAKPQLDGLTNVKVLDERTTVRLGNISWASKQWLCLGVMVSYAAIAHDPFRYACSARHDECRS